MKTKSTQILILLLTGAVLAGSAFAAPQVTRKRVKRQTVRQPSRHPSPYGRHQQKGMRHYVAERGTSYTVVNGYAVPVPARVIYTTPTPVYVGPTVVTTTYYTPGQAYTPAYWNFYAPPPPNPRPAIVYTPYVRPGINFNISF